MNLAWMRLLQILREGEGLSNNEGGKPNGHARHEEEDDDEDDRPDDPDTRKDVKAWQTYAKRLRTEAANKRAENRKLKDEIETLKADKKKAETDHAKAIEKAINDEKVKYDALIADGKKQTDALAIENDLRAHATKAGCKDVDDLLKLIDKSTTTIDDKGAVTGGEKAIEEFKKAKPHLFGSASPSSTSNSQQPAPNKAGETKNAKDMTDEEYAAAKASFTGHYVRR